MAALQYHYQNEVDLRFQYEYQLAAVLYYKLNRDTYIVLFLILLSGAASLSIDASLILRPYLRIVVVFLR